MVLEQNLRKRHNTHITFFQRFSLQFAAALLLAMRHFVVIAGDLANHLVFESNHLIRQGLLHMMPISRDTKFSSSYLALTALCVFA